MYNIQGEVKESVPDHFVSAHPGADDTDPEDEEEDEVNRNKRLVDYDERDDNLERKPVGKQKKVAIIDEIIMTVDDE